MDADSEEKHYRRLWESGEKRHDRRDTRANHEGGAYTVQRSEHIPETNAVARISGHRRLDAESCQSGTG